MEATNWNNLSEELKKNVVSNLPYKDRCSLRKCSKTERAVVDATPLRILKLLVVLHQVHIRLHFFQPTDLPMCIHYWRFEMCCKQKRIYPGSMKEVVHRDGTWIGMGLGDLECLLRMSGLEVEELVVTCKDGYNWDQLSRLLERIRGQRQIGVQDQTHFQNHDQIQNPSPEKIKAHSLQFFGDTDHEAFFRSHIDFSHYRFERLHGNIY